MSAAPDEQAEKKPSWGEFFLGWFFGILSVLALVFARKTATKIEDVKDKIPSD